MNFTKSNLLREKAKRLIPGGAHTYSKGDDQFPELSPGFIVKGKGTKVWDPDGNEFIDWGMGLRSVILGHAYEPVLDVVKEQLELGSNFTRPSLLEAEVAETLVDLIPSAEMVKFAKNGSDVTTAAVKLARAYTGRDVVVRCYDHPFFSVDDWFIGNTACNAGIPEAVQSLTDSFRYNDVDSLNETLARHEGNVACVIMETSTAAHPKEGFLEQVREITARKGIVLIFDEIITGFRWGESGSQKLYGVTPDLSTFGKAIANGFSLAALVGRKDIMRLGGLDHELPRVFLLSTTNGSETHSLAAAKKTIDIIKEYRVCDYIAKVGSTLTSGFNEIIAEFELQNFIQMAGLPCSPLIMFTDKDGNTDFGLRTLFLQETIKRGILIPYIAPSYSHSETDIAATLAAVKDSMPVIQAAVHERKIDSYLVGGYTKPVFRKFN